MAEHGLDRLAPALKHLKICNTDELLEISSDLSVLREAILYSI